MSPEILQVVSSGGGLSVCLVMLFWFRKYLTEHTRTLQEITDKHNARVDKLIADYNERADNIVSQFRADIMTISTDTSATLEALTIEVKMLAGKIKE